MKHVFRVEVSTKNAGPLMDEPPDRQAWLVCTLVEGALEEVEVLPWVLGVDLTMTGTLLNGLKETEA
jgi:hypothetical protein